MCGCFGGYGAGAGAGAGARGGGGRGARVPGLGAVGDGTGTGTGTAAGVGGAVGGGGVVGGVVVGGVVVIAERRGGGDASDGSNWSALRAAGPVRGRGAGSGKSIGGPLVYGGGLEEALVLVPEGAHAAFSREFGGVVELADVGRVAGVESFFEHFDDGALEGDDLALELGLGKYWVVLVLSLAGKMAWGR